jgi:hypothetical protein
MRAGNLVDDEETETKACRDVASAPEGLKEDRAQRFGDGLP